MEPLRGIAPALLVEQVRNTAPWVFSNPSPNPIPPPFVALQNAAQAALTSDSTLSPVEYFRLCLSAHFSTVATFVPTDVDNAIRFKLWQPELGTDVVQEMARVVLDEWPEWETHHLHHVSTRTLALPKPLTDEGLGTHLSGHTGEWFSVAVAAYGATRTRHLDVNPDVNTEIATRVDAAVERHARIIEYFVSQRDYRSLLCASTIAAHNLGDLDRVFDAWNIGASPSDADALKSRVYKLGHTGDERLGGWLVLAGNLNKEIMAADNHRYFALRKPRCLRKSPELLLPIAPYLDEWGRRVARHPLLSRAEVGEVVEALMDGFERLKTDGFVRALSGIWEAFPGGPQALLKELPARAARTLKAGDLRQRVSLSEKKFEENLVQKAERLTRAWKTR